MEQQAVFHPAMADRLFGGDGVDYFVDSVFEAAFGGGYSAGAFDLLGCVSDGVSEEIGFWFSFGDVCFSIVVR